MSTLKIENISKSFGNKKVLDSINLEISEGMYGLLGANGVGKTTLMRTITTLLIPDNGKIRFDNIDCLRESEKMRHILGYLPQHFGCYRNITARECLDYIGVLKGLHDETKRRQKIEDILEQVNLIESKDKKLKKFSGGMMRRLGIAQALLGDPRLLIVDEPTAGLDPEERIRFRSLLRSFSKGRTVLISTHIVEDIQATCKGVAALRNGKMQYFSALAEMTSIARGKVWKISLSEEKDYKNIEEQCTIISTEAKPNGNIELRVIAHTKPADNAISVEPSIEEGYILWNNQ